MLAFQEQHSLSPMPLLQQMQTLQRPLAPSKAHRGPFRCRKVAVCSLPVLQDSIIESGQLTVQYLQQDDIQGAGLLLVRAFAGTPEAVKLDEALKFMQKHVFADGDEVTLVAKLVPTDPKLLPPNKSSRLVGAVSLSFSSKDRESFSSLAPPEDEVYLANMAVDPKLRRQGIAKAMLAACDAAANARSQPAIWLHVRQADDAAQKLYSGYGYEQVDKDQAMLGGLFGNSNGSQRPRILMRKQLC